MLYSATVSESSPRECYSHLPSVSSDSISLPTSKQQQTSTAEGLEASRTLQASPIRPRKFGVGPARGLMKGKDADKPVVHLHWLVRLTEVGRLRYLVKIECTVWFSCLGSLK